MSFDTQGNLSYMGVVPATPPQMETHTRDPLPQDFTYPVGTFWLVKGTVDLWFLVSTSLNNIPILGDRAWWVKMGTGVSSTQYVTNSGVAVPLLNTLKVYGGSNITTNAIIGPPNTITIDLNTNVVIDGSLKLNSFNQGVMQVDALGFAYTDNGTDGQILIAGAAGTNPIWANIIPGTPNVTIGNAPNSITISVAGGGGGGFNGLVADDTNTAAPDGSDLIYLTGDGVLTQTTAAVANTLAVTVVPGLDAQVIGGITGSPSVWKTIRSPLGSISVNSTATEIQLESVGSGAVGILTGDAGPGATPDMATAIKITGAGGMLTTDAGTTGAHEVYIDIVDPNVDGQLIISSASGMPIWSNLVAGANVTILPGPNTITISATGGGGSGGASTFPTNSGVANSTVGNTLYVYGGTNTHSLAQTTLNPLDTVVVDLNQVIYWPNTNAGASTGVIFLGGNRYLHNYGTNNTWYGSNAGNMALSGANNVGIGTNALTNVTTGHSNCICGNNAGDSITTGSDCTAFGDGALASNTTGSYQTAVGWNACANSTVGGNTAVGAEALRYGSLGGNVAVGYQAGRTAAVGQNNTILGGYCGAKLDGGSNNLFAGYNVRSSGGLAPLQSYCTMLGYNAEGTGNSCIAIGGTTAARANSIQIGTQGSGNGQQNTAYMAGIYGVAVGATNAPVYIDSTGKLGTGAATYQPAFLAVQTGSVGNVTGDDTVYWLGTLAVLNDTPTTGYDLGNNFYQGSGAGAPCVFTSPFKGLYYLQITTLISGIYTSAPPPPPPVGSTTPLTITTYNASGTLYREYNLWRPVITYQGTGFPATSTQSITYNIICFMDVNYTAKFSVSLYYQDGTKTLGVAGGAAGQINTYVCGNIISTIT